MELEDKSAASSGGIVELTQTSLISRLLYPNPVCMLTVWAGNGEQAPATSAPLPDKAAAVRPRRNVMTISWLTCINNQVGLVFCAVNKRRHTASLLRVGRSFVLNVPVQGMEELVLAVGGCTGKDEDKFDKLNLDLCQPGWTDLDTMIEDGGDRLLAIRPCVAHVVCRVEAVQDKAGHLLLHCRLQRAWVRPDYWNGKNFIPQRPGVPPYFTFLGAQTFGYVWPHPPPSSSSSSSSSSTSSSSSSSSSS
ncbi:uncharacterized protein ACA1_046120 [Acanthamoeba castellanii str. Neff]|uniref:Flavin reductase like domain-containing protein n=1 Tax=Acanthamoeba castellanii (strain ATCC 30010 / Neff) TaxID=1257118 RepID=L8HB06_ACACF|nr:uncharacterized protein ACA1_046120 [Acanthamoeba castellanii str. Neff]ELR21913.1 hypothetical protein ACA1_046120 [Acanthamoeba castellanii str. Neff]